MLALVNRSDRPQVTHVHGHHFRLLDRLDDGWKPFWLDTVLVPPRETQRIAFVADHSGKWLIDCHATAEPRATPPGWFEVR
jgi:FtsP/CotA-like multicopper oxidase with cupredoxin domain